MLSWFKGLFGGEGRRMQYIDLRSQREMELQQQGTAPLPDEKDEKIAHELTAASHKKENDTIKKIGARLNEEGGLERMKTIYYRAEYIGADGRWVEMMWSGIGEWMG